MVTTTRAKWAEQIQSPYSEDEDDDDMRPAPFAEKSRARKSKKTPKDLKKNDSPQSDQVSKTLRTTGSIEPIKVAEERTSREFQKRKHEGLNDVHFWEPEEKLIVTGFDGDDDGYNQWSSTPRSARNRKIENISDDYRSQYSGSTSPSRNLKAHTSVKARRSFFPKPLRKFKPFLTLEQSLQDKIWELTLPVERVIEISAIELTSGYLTAGFEDIPLIRTCRSSRNYARQIYKRCFGRKDNDDPRTTATLLSPIYFNPQRDWLYLEDSKTLRYFHDSISFTANFPLYKAVDPNGIPNPISWSFAGIRQVLLNMPLSKEDLDAIYFFMCSETPLLRLTLGIEEDLVHPENTHSKNPFEDNQQTILELNRQQLANTKQDVMESLSVRIATGIYCEDRDTNIEGIYRPIVTKNKPRLPFIHVKTRHEIEAILEYHESQ